MIENHITYRNYLTCDHAALKKMWKDAFHDDIGFDLYNQHLFRAEDTFVAALNEIPVSVAYQYHNKGFYIAGKQTVPCACHYAFATDEAHRGEHIGMNLLQHILDDQDTSGVSFSMIAPADEGLRELYKAHFQYEDFFYINELIVAPEDMATWSATAAPSATNDQAVITDPAAAGAIPSIYRIRPEEYLAFREKLLAGTNHIVHTLDQIKYQNDLCDASKGGLFHITLYGTEGILALERDQDQTLLCKELLIPDSGIVPVLSALFRKFSSKKAVCWLPDWSNPGFTYTRVPIALLRRNSCSTFVNTKAANVCQLTNSQLPQSGYAGLLFG